MQDSGAMRGESVKLRLAVIERRNASREGALAVYS
jgi:hypothetical protein